MEPCGASLLVDCSLRSAALTSTDLIPPYDPGLPLATRTPTWLGGTTLPALTEHLTAKISAHYVGPDKRRRLAFVSALLVVSASDGAGEAR